MSSGSDVRWLVLDYVCGLGWYALNIAIVESRGVRAIDRMRGRFGEIQPPSARIFWFCALVVCSLAIAPLWPLMALWVLDRYIRWFRREYVDRDGLLKPQMPAPRIEAEFEYERPCPFCGKPIVIFDQGDHVNTVDMGHESPSCDEWTRMNASPDPNAYIAEKMARGEMKAYEVRLRAIHCADCSHSWLEPGGLTPQQEMDFERQHAGHKLEATLMDGTRRAVVTTEDKR